MNVLILSETERFLVSCLQYELGLSSECSWDEFFAVLENNKDLVGRFFIDHLRCVKCNANLEHANILGGK